MTILSAPQSDFSRRFGLAAENATAAWLEQQGYIVVARRFVCRYGELDLILRDGGNGFICIEVKGSQTKRTDVVERVTLRKQKKLVLGVAEYAQRFCLEDSPWRFDVVLAFFQNSQWDFVWHKAAFDADVGGFF